MAAPSEIAARIRWLRLRSEKSGEEMAAALGISPSGVSRLEHGKRTAYAHEQVTIAEFLGVSPLMILDPYWLPDEDTTP